MNYIKIKFDKTKQAQNSCNYLNKSYNTNEMVWI